MDVGSGPAHNYRYEWQCLYCGNENWHGRPQCWLCCAPRPSNIGYEWLQCAYCHDPRRPWRTHCRKCYEPRSDTHSGWRGWSHWRVRQRQYQANPDVGIATPTAHTDGQASGSRDRLAATHSPGEELRKGHEGQNKSMSAGPSAGNTSQPDPAAPSDIPEGMEAAATSLTPTRTRASENLHMATIIGDSEYTTSSHRSTNMTTASPPRPDPYVQSQGPPSVSSDEQAMDAHPSPRPLRNPNAARPEGSSLNDHQATALHPGNQGTRHSLSATLVLSDHDTLDKGNLE